MRHKGNEVHITEQDMNHVIDLLNNYPDAELEAMANDVNSANAELERMGPNYTLGPMPSVTLDDAYQLEQGKQGSITEIFHHKMTPKVREFVYNLHDKGLGLIDAFSEKQVGMLKGFAQKVVKGIKSFIKGVRKLLGRAGEYNLSMGESQVNKELDEKKSKPQNKEFSTSYENPLFDKEALEQEAKAAENERWHNVKVASSGAISQNRIDARKEKEAQAARWQKVVDASDKAIEGNIKRSHAEKFAPVKQELVSQVEKLQARRAAEGPSADTAKKK